MMNQEEHKARHKLLHGEFDELLADWITHTGGLPSQHTIIELMQWSHQQTIQPTEMEK